MTNHNKLITALHNEIDILVSILIMEGIKDKYIDKDGNLLPETLWLI